MDLINDIEKRLSLFKNLYDYIRIIDPVKKKVIAYRMKSKDSISNDTENPCFVMWKKSSFCENCISMRAYIHNDTFVKIEYDKERIMLITAAPVEIDGYIYIAEIIKDISKNDSIIHKLNKESWDTGEFIDCMNEKTITDRLTGIYNKKYISERLPIDLNYCKINSLPISIIMTEIDSLEAIKQQYGRGAVEKILIFFSSMIKGSIRNNGDWVGRYSTKKFVMVLNDTEVIQADAIAEALRAQLENCPIDYKGVTLYVTSSFGVYGVTELNIHYTELLLKVDKNLHKAIISGSNKTISNQAELYISNISNQPRNNMKLDKLDRQINELREVLNEICATFEDDEVSSKRLLISQCLDELIVEYMKEQNSLG